MGSIVVNEKNFVVIDAWKMLMYWCSIRDLPKYVVYSKFLRKDVEEINLLLAWCYDRKYRE
jgi:hypothetical protein